MVVRHVRGDNICPVLALSLPATAAAAAAAAAAATGQNCDDFVFSLSMELGGGFDLGGQDEDLLCSSSSSSSGGGGGGGSSGSADCFELAARVGEATVCS